MVASSPKQVSSQKYKRKGREEFTRTHSEQFQIPQFFISIKNEKGEVYLYIYISIYVSLLVLENVEPVTLGK